MNEQNNVFETRMLSDWYDVFFYIHDSFMQKIHFNIKQPETVRILLTEQCMKTPCPKREEWFNIVLNHVGMFFPSDYLIEMRSVPFDGLTIGTRYDIIGLDGAYLGNVRIVPKNLSNIHGNT